MVLTAVFAAFTVSTLYRLYIFCRKSKKFFLNNTDKKLIQNIKNITLPAVSYFSQELRAMMLLKKLPFKLFILGLLLERERFIYNLFYRAFLCYSFIYRAAKAYFTLRLFLTQPAARAAAEAASSAAGTTMQLLLPVFGDFTVLEVL